jgi:hypothetical protein
LKGRTIAIDATTLEANAAMRSIVMRHLIGVGTPRGLQGRLGVIIAVCFGLVAAL